MNILSSYIKYMIIITMVLINTSHLNATILPWGKDADLASKTQISIQKPTPCKTPIVGPLSEVIIGFHQTTLTICDGPRSNFRPSSSQYMLDAMRKYGFFKGFSMGCDRLMRENADPWVYRFTLNEQNQRMKYDPVP